MILLTGMTGKSGRWFLQNLINSNENIRSTRFRVVVRNSSNTDLINKSGLSIEKANGDLNDSIFLDEVMKDIDTIFHIAGIHTSLKVVKAAIKNNVKWIVLVHTTGIYSKYKSAGEEYRQTEKLIEELISGSNITLTILRPTMIYGSLNDNNVAIFIKMVDKLHFFPVVNHASYPLQPVHEKDLGDAYYRVLINERITKGRNYILSGKSPILLIDIFKTIGRLLGKKNKFISVPYRIAYFGAVIVYFTSLGKIDYREKVQTLVEPRIFSYEDAKKDFGYSPMSFEEGIINEIDEYKNAAFVKNSFDA
ncbi:MAG: NAD(P)H-binding protein [Smithellaceae bacterium]|jgi:nucleoside-diphosphate-sugar epimerase